MPMHIGYRINAALERILPEQRLFLKSDRDTRFVRLRPATQAIAIAAGGVMLLWTVVATSILLLDFVNAGSARSQQQVRQARYEERLDALSQDRDRRADEAASAQERFNLALAEVSKMQTRLLASEDRRELETGIEVIQATLRRTIQERDSARAELAETQGTEVKSGPTAAERAADTTETLAFLTGALQETAGERDLMEGAARDAVAKVDAVAAERDAILARNAEIFTQLEDAITVSMEPLDKMFAAAGLSPDSLLKSVRSGYSGQGGPLGPLALSASGAAPSTDEMRANALLGKLDEVNMYRIAATKVPLVLPVTSSFRYTSGFGVRQDPKGWGRRMHEGVDMAGSYGAPVYATADGVVIYAGWENGYGLLVKIKHDFGIETRYGHLSQIRVGVGQRVSRGDKIGDMGNSGRSTGTHLHYEVRVNGAAKNPMTFIKAGTNVF
ncbi:MAG: peptidoglycan DD-metalloendopeptidase family protein [Exiguobacterium profundum]|nr:MAG: peptidoglycan DD-metalloendopeptidase family protein [Exiguobacterium profundum]